MRRSLATIAAAAVAALAASLGPSAGAEPAVPTIVERTTVCSVGKRAGVRKIEVHARSGTRLFEDPRRWKFLASASLVDPTSRGAGLAWLLAGWPPLREPGQLRSSETLGIAVRCRPSSARVPPTPTGLSGFAASPLEDEYHCVVPRRIVVGVRALFRAPASLRLNRRWGQLTARGIVREGSLAIRTEAGRPIALATVHESGRARLFVAGSCEPDLIQSDG